LPCGFSRRLRGAGQRHVIVATPYAYAFAIPCHTPGLRFICRESFDIGRSHVDHPLGSRFEEMEAIVVFDDALLPWERVVLKGDMELCNNVFSGTNAVLHIAKAEFLLGLACLMAHTIAIEGFQHVQEKLAEMMTYVETMKAAAWASEVDRYLQAVRADALERIRPFRLAWDVACSSFGARQVLYERFFFGDPVRMMSALYNVCNVYDKEPLMERVRAFLARDDGPSA
jgi:4-hydroxyphenylacetate 3-monooxygenase